MGMTTQGMKIHLLRINPGFFSLIIVRWKKNILTSGTNILSHARATGSPSNADYPFMGDRLTVWKEKIFWHLVEDYPNNLIDWLIKRNFVNILHICRVIIIYVPEYFFVPNCSPIKWAGLSLYYRPLLGRDILDAGLHMTQHLLTC